MLYQSTRSNHTVTSLEAILQGIAPDGGLYLPVDLASMKVLPQDLADKSFEEMAAIILRTLFDEFTEDEMAEMVHRAYGGKFETEDVTPTVKVGNDYVLELFRGPTSAFKDVALSMLPAANSTCTVARSTVVMQSMAPTLRCGMMARIKVGS